MRRREKEEVHELGAFERVPSDGEEAGQQLRRAASKVGIVTAFARVPSSRGSGSQHAPEFGRATSFGRAASGASGVGSGRGARSLAARR